MLGQAAQATISYLKLPQGNSCFPDVDLQGKGDQTTHRTRNQTRNSKIAIDLDTENRSAGPKEAERKAKGPGKTTKEKGPRL